MERLMLTAADCSVVKLAFSGTHLFGAFQTFAFLLTFYL